MRLSARPNLTVALIRQARFEDHAAHLYGPRHVRPMCEHLTALVDDCPQRAIGRRPDKVELGRETQPAGYWPIGPAIPSQVLHDAGLTNVGPVGALDAAPAPPQALTPVVGSPALAGLGVSLVVPGTLLDVVA